MKPNPTMLLLVGLACFPLGPLAGVPGILIGRKMAERGMRGDLGYFLCWAITALYGAAFVVGFIAAVTVPMWDR
jgi:hypothetical protein